MQRRVYLIYVTDLSSGRRYLIGRGHMSTYSLTKGWKTYSLAYKYLLELVSKRSDRIYEILHFDL